MPSPVVLATSDPALAEVWARQCGAGREFLRLGVDVFPEARGAGVAAVVVLDAVCADSLPESLQGCPTVFVGEPRSRPYEQARLAGRAKAVLSYEQSATQLAPLIPILEELAVAHLLAARAVVGGESAAPAVGGPSGSGVIPGAIAAALLERLDSPEALGAEMGRVWREVLGASRAEFFRLKGMRLEAAAGTDAVSLDEDLFGLLKRNPMVLDGRHWPEGTAPRGALAVESLLARRAARLIVPVHESGRLLGIFLLGVREDGRDYDAADRARGVDLARLMRLALLRSEEMVRLRSVEHRAALAAKHLPGALLLEPGEEPARDLPLVVREVIGELRHNAGDGRRDPAEGQPLRVRGGNTDQAGGVWVRWEDAAAELIESRERDRRARRELLRELALTLSHELGNALVSLTTFRQAGGERPLPAAMLETMRADIGRLQRLNSQFGLMQTMHEAEAGTVDVKELAQEIGRSLGLRVEASSEPAVLNADRRLLDFALRSFLETIGENRGELGLRELALKVRRVGDGPDTIALVSLKGKPLELEGVLPPPTEDSVPSHGHLKVLLAREILALHHGEIHAGPGMEGTEILISIRHL